MTHQLGFKYVTVDLGCSLAKVATALGKLVNIEVDQEIPKVLGRKEMIA